MEIKLFKTYRIINTDYLCMFVSKNPMVMVRTLAMGISVIVDKNHMDSGLELTDGVQAYNFSEHIKRYIIHLSSVSHVCYAMIALWHLDMSEYRKTTHKLIENVLGVHIKTFPWD